MTADSQSPQGARKPVAPAPIPSSPLAQAIAEAWKRETQESQEKWRRMDANVRHRYNAPRRPDAKTKM
ncbi:hypothetical protein FA15DRAFT_590926 [Coprinopsis marcescibilis]|uniref:Uncharacterized protein n=1 Tax=Coprinopsis marcescibilis TaxID=230819 RepID=A0A5C3KX38_COPMA|nr:hypothetical protein FA15DRAFT_590926 [Coprinopsis marcescibilis]